MKSENTLKQFTKFSKRVCPGQPKRSRNSGCIKERVDVLFDLLGALVSIILLTYGIMLLFYFIVELVVEIIRAFRR